MFILIISYYYYYAIALGPLFLFFMFSAAFYRSSAREVKRHEAVLRSTVFARFSEAVMGTPTIRAYGLQNQFSNSVRTAIDDMNSAYYLTFANQRWLSVRLDIVGILLVFTTGILVVTSRFSVDPSIAGLVLSYILTIVQMIQFTVRQLAEVENNMNSTERIHHYGTQLEEEAALRVGNIRPTWPEHGEIIFDNVEMRYRDGLPLVLKGLSMHVRAGERIGVVGRTGAGKSTIMSTLFRLQELSGGSIVIDGVDISQIGLHDLRSKLAIIPQDPTLFKGTIRSNLDPFHEHSDLELWSSLRQADLVSNEQTMDDHSGRIHLDSVVEEEGTHSPPPPSPLHLPSTHILTHNHQDSTSPSANANSWRSPAPWSAVPKSSSATKPPHPWTLRPTPKSRRPSSTGSAARRCSVSRIVSRRSSTTIAFASWMQDRSRSWTPHWRCGKKEVFSGECARGVGFGGRILLGNSECRVAGYT